MPTMDQIPQQDDSVHLLLIGDTKAGKSTYAAQAAKDGFNVIYIDCDNGLSALRYALKDSPEAQKRVHYFDTKRPKEFITNFLRSTSKNPLRWNPRLNRVWGKLATGVEPNDIVWVLDITKVPKSWLIVIDSWTAVSADALGIGSADQRAELLDGTNQAIYGEANAALTYICNMIQKLPQHVIVQAHGTKYEVYEKPTNVTAGTVKQKDMILRETIDVPLSSSRPHGQVMATRFNHIGWLAVNGLGETEIDFMRKPNRVGGGPPNIKKKTSELTFLKLAGGSLPTAEEDSTGWYTEMTHEALAA